MNKLTYEQALRRLAVYCSRSERCVTDVRKKMDAWEIPIDRQNEIVQQLQKEKYIDEERYCKAFINDKIKYNRWGIHKIRFELRKKQIPEALIREKLKKLNPEETCEQLRLLIEQKKKSVTGKDDYEIRQKLLRFAASRGFALDEIEKVLNGSKF